MGTAIDSTSIGAFLRPRSIALVGRAFEEGYASMLRDNITRPEVPLRAYLVDDGGTESSVLRTVRSCEEISEPVDLAYLMLPEEQVLAALEDAARAGIPRVCIGGPMKPEVQALVLHHAAARDIEIMGPNVGGFINVVDGYPVGMFPRPPTVAGPIAIVSQSGGCAQAMLDIAEAQRAYVGYVVTTGNEAMVTAAHVVDFLVDDPSTRVVALFAEEIRETALFLAAVARANAMGKAVVVLKVGASELAARTALTHTGAIVGDDDVTDAVFRRHGVVRVRSFEEMVVTAKLLAHAGPLAKARVGIVSISGGICDVVADQAALHDVPLADLTPETVAAISVQLPELQDPHNPVDATGEAAIDPAVFTALLEAVGRDEEVGILVAMNEASWSDGALKAMYRAVRRGMERGRGPAVYMDWFMRSQRDHTGALATSAGIDCVLGGLEFGMRALGHLCRWSEAVHRLTAPSCAPAPSVVEVVTDRVRRGRWSEPEVRGMLEAAGLAVTPGSVAHSAEEAVRSARHYGGPVAVKVVSSRIQHKASVGGVRLHVLGDDAVKDAYVGVTSSANATTVESTDAVLVSPMRTNGIELLVGVKRDTQWGLVLVIALGGSLVEAFDRKVLADLPVDEHDVLRMLESLRCSSLLTARPASTRVEMRGIVDAVVRLADVAACLGDDLESLEVNPLWIGEDAVEVMDAVISWAD